MTATALVARLDSAYRGAADPTRAPRMERYMRDQFAFLGISNPARRRIGAELVAEAASQPDALPAVARWCFAQPEREFQYFACDALRRAAPRRLGPEHLQLTEELVATKSWWDTIDTLAANVVGALVRRFPELTRDMDRWIREPELWLRRAALLHQLKYGERTDARRLFAYAERCAREDDFFIRKAIGWALREYAKTDPESVRGFLADHDRDLAPLSVREASKHLG